MISQILRPVNTSHWVAHNVAQGSTIGPRNAVAAEQYDLVPTDEDSQVAEGNEVAAQVSRSPQAAHPAAHGEQKLKSLRATDRQFPTHCLLRTLPVL